MLPLFACMLAANYLILRLHGCAYTFAVRVSKFQTAPVTAWEYVGLVPDTHPLYVHIYLTVIKRKMQLIGVERPSNALTSLFCLFVLLLYVPSQQLWSLRDGQFT